MSILGCGYARYEAFILDGFSNWKKAFECHQLSECHKEAQLKLKGLQTLNIMEQLTSQATKAQSENRVMLFLVSNSY